jgi:hypothetical protein
MKAARFVCALCVPAIEFFPGGREAKAACAIANKAHCDPQRSAQPHTHTRITLVICTTLRALSSTAEVTIVGFVKPSFLQRRGPTAIKTVPAIDRQLAWNTFISDLKANTLPYIQLPLPLHRRIGHHTVRHYNDTLSTRTDEYPPSAFHLTIHSLPSTLKQLLSHAVGPSN